MIVEFEVGWRLFIVLVFAVFTFPSAMARTIAVTRKWTRTTKEAD